jgi:phosphoglycerate dehydrogenase-like enzyme
MNIVFHYDSGSDLTARLHSLADKGFMVTQVSVDDQQEFTRAVQQCDVLWHVLEPVTSEHIYNSPRLKLIQKIGVGVNTIDVAAAKSRGITVCNMPGTNAPAVAEMTLLLILSTLRKSTYFDKRTREGNGWNFDPNLQDSLNEVRGKTVGFVGYGSIPQQLTPVLQTMGARVIYNATTPKETTLAEFKPLDDLLTEADIVSLHVPLTAETKKLMNSERFSKMKVGAIFINTARGEVVDENALIHSLQSNHLRGAGLDVFANEPVDRLNPLLQMDNVTLMRHLSWLTQETLHRSIAVAVENCERLRNGTELLHRV